MRYLCLLLIISGCRNQPTVQTPAGTIAAASNHQSSTTTVNVSFGADSVIQVADWSNFCTGSGLVCTFPLAGHGQQALPTLGKYLNATISFDGAGCGVTKAEININNPNWYDILDVSLVDGYSNKIEIVAAPIGGSALNLGPPNGKTGNQKVYGLFPLGCDICTARQNPPCNIPMGNYECKDGTQYKPDVPCQWQGTVKGGGGLAVDVQLL